VHAVTTLGAPNPPELQTLEVRVGMTLAAGQTLAKLNGLAAVWLEAAVPEAQATFLAVGQPASAQFAAFPGERFAGKVAALLPEVNADSRTLRLRVELANPKGRLRPGMFAQLHLDAGTAVPALWLPSEAVIRTGRRNLVIAALDGGRFLPVEVQLGRDSDGKTEVRQGLAAGQQVVASGQFLIDSEASLSGVLARLGGLAETSRPAAGGTVLHHGVGKVEAVSDGEITVSHEPIASVGWGAMTMPFKLASPMLVRGIKPGDRVGFDFTAGDDGFVVQHVAKAGGKP
jgi:Cu(I)/Ag(I) efflux system membrane fusion protein